MLCPARKTVALILSLLFVWLTLPGAAGAQSDQKTPVTKPPFARQLGPFLSAQENLAYSLGVQAYIYGYPLVASAKTMTEMTQQRAPFNQFYYADSLATPAYRDIVTPNSYTLYMSACLAERARESAKPLLYRANAGRVHEYVSQRLQPLN